MLLEVDGIRTQYAQLQKASAGQLSEITSLKEKFNKAELEKQLALQRANLLENDNRKLLLQIESSERRLTELNDSLRTLANSGGDGKLDQ